MKHIQILVVDDEQGIQESLRGVLEDEGFSVQSVGRGEDALEELQKRSYDVVLLDVWLPGIDGLDTLEKIQEMPLSERPNVVMISGHGNIETAVRATKMGAFDFLEKPLTIEKVTVTIQNALKQRKLEVEVERLKGASGESRRGGHVHSGHGHVHSGHVHSGHGPDLRALGVAGFPELLRLVPVGIARCVVHPRDVT